MTHDNDSGLIPSRRTIIRAGAHAAWAVPAIQIATMVPASAAVSGAPEAQMLVTAKSLVRIPTPLGKTKNLTGSMTLKNNGTGPTGAIAVLFTKLTIITVDTRHGIWRANTNGWAMSAGNDLVPKDKGLAVHAELAAGQSSTLNFTIAPTPLWTEWKGNGIVKLTFVVSIGKAGTGTAGQYNQTV
ncbi:MAG: hypothetical protein NTX33_06765 [Propionibacteriales bacterium]|nr:hypothetical protein [Propionibacteriales bacterium]